MCYKKCLSIAIALLISTTSAWALSPPRAFSVPVVTDDKEINMMKMVVVGAGDGECGVTFDSSYRSSGTINFDSIPELGKTCYVYFCDALPCGPNEPFGTRHRLHIILTLAYNDGIGLWQDTFPGNEYMQIGPDGPEGNPRDIVCNVDTLDAEACALRLKKINKDT